MPKDQLQLVRSSKYPFDAFLFVQRGLDYTVRRIHGDPASAQDAANRHVSGQSLCNGLRDYALQQYGLLARAVLGHWRIHSSEDFGHIVFALVDAGLMHKTDDDSIDDFIGVYEFDEAFAPELQLSKKN